MINKNKNLGYKYIMSLSVVMPKKQEKNKIIGFLENLIFLWSVGREAGSLSIQHSVWSLPLMLWFVVISKKRSTVCVAALKGALAS